MELTQADRQSIFSLLGSRFEDMGRHFRDVDHMFEISTSVWDSPTECIFVFPEVDRAFLFKEVDGTRKIREVWLADSEEMRSIAQANGGRYIFDFENPNAVDQVTSVYAMS